MSEDTQPKFLCPFCEMREHNPGEQGYPEYLQHIAECEVLFFRRHVKKLASLEQLIVRLEKIANKLEGQG